jgi:hypothetical protein
VVEPHLLAYHLAFFTAAGLTVIGAIFAFGVHDGDAASTMRKPPLPDVHLEGQVEAQALTGAASG